MANRYDKGDLVRTGATWTDPINSDAPIDPAVVKLSVRNPSGVVTTYEYGVDVELKRSGVGVYYSDIDIDESGRWYFRWWATGTGQAAEEVSLVAVAPKAV